MAGVITWWDVIRNPIIIIQGFGWRAFFAALFGSHATFLACVAAEMVQ